jgi:calcineurin-like phosphoesterase
MASNRNAGNFIFEQNEFLRPVQIAKNHYGQGVKLMKIIVLNKEVFQEEECINPFLSSKKGYNLDGTHHISLIKFDNKTIIATDGKNNNFYSVVNN